MSHIIQPLVAGSRSKSMNILSGKEVGTMPDDFSNNELQGTDERSQNTEPFVFGMLIGTLLGGGIALLFAPMKGSDTRKLIKEQLKDAEEMVQETQSTITFLKKKFSELSIGVGEIAAEVKNFNKNA
jgi:gas vesicle protein